MMNALEKLGWTRIENDYGWLVYFKNQRQISIHFTKKIFHLDGELTLEELLAIAEVIKEEEKK